MEKNMLTKKRTKYTKLIALILLKIDLACSKITIITSKMPDLFLTHNAKVDLTPMVDLSETDPITLKYSSTKGDLGFQFRTRSWIINLNVPVDIKSFSIDDYSGAYYASYDEVTSFCYSGILNSKLPKNIPGFSLSEKSCYNSVGNIVFGGIGNYFFAYYDYDKMKLITIQNEQVEELTAKNFQIGIGLDSVIRGTYDSHGYFVMQGFIYRIADDYEGNYDGNTLIKFDVESSGKFNYVEENLFAGDVQDKIKVRWVNCAFREEDPTPILYCWLRIMDIDGSEKTRLVRRIEKDGLVDYEKLFDIPISDGAVGVDKSLHTGWRIYSEFDLSLQTLKICDISYPEFDPTVYDNYVKNCFEKSINIIFGSSRYVKFLKLNSNYIILQVADKSEIKYDKFFVYSTKKKHNYAYSPSCSRRIQYR